MDPATIAFISALLVSVTGNMAQFAMRIMDGNRANGKPLVASIKGEIAIHEVNCSNLKLIMDRLEKIDNKLDRHLEAHDR